MGVLEGVERSTSETDTAQGSLLSPLLGNVYLHDALDRWFEQGVRPQLRGQATLTAMRLPSGNFRSLLLVLEQARRTWYKWLCRRSQRERLTWERFAHLLCDFPLPQPRITVPIWGG